MLKPVVLNEFHQAIEHVMQQIEVDNLQKPKQLGTLSQVMEGIFSGSISIDEEICLYMKNQFQITMETPIALICFYLGSLLEEKRSRIQADLVTLLQQRKDFSYCIIPSIYEKSLIAVVYGYEKGHSIERWIQYQILSGWNKNMQIGIGWREISTLQNLKKDFKELYPYLDWNIVLGENVIVSYPKITKIQTVPCIYPVKIEDTMKLSVCNNQQKVINECMDNFHQHFQSGQVYAPKEIKECYVRFLWAFINTSIEVGFENGKKIEQQKILESIMGAKTKNELKEVSQELLNWILTEEDKEITHLTVKRAINMIHEFYSSGITLEEISDKLNITPEYLGTQFTKEMGVNFSTYIKNYRIAKAKELLIGTSMKVYEIAMQVGYMDGKYFSKVFKEHCGQLPAEYRKAYK